MYSAVLALALLTPATEGCTCSRSAGCSATTTTTYYLVPVASCSSAQSGCSQSYGCSGMTRREARLQARAARIAARHSNHSVVLFVPVEAAPAQKRQYGATAPKTDGKAYVVTMKGMAYDPAKLEIKVGDSVTWTNNDKGQHTATSDDAAKTFDTGKIAPGTSSKAVVFDKAGTYAYHCTVHGKEMAGTVVVTAAK